MDTELINTPRSEKKQFTLLARELKLNLKQRKMAHLFALSDEFFGNGVQSYIEVYKPDQTKPNWYNSALATSSEMLRRPNVSKYINAILEMRGLNDNFADKRLEFLMTQNADFRTALGAIQEYNKLKKRIEGNGNKVLIVNVSGEVNSRYSNALPPNTNSSN